MPTPTHKKGTLPALNSNTDWIKTTIAQITKKKKVQKSIAGGENVNVQQSHSFEFFSAK